MIIGALGTIDVGVAADWATWKRHFLADVSLIALKGISNPSSTTLPPPLWVFQPILDALWLRKQCYFREQAAHEIAFMKIIQFCFIFSTASECFQRFDFYGVEYVFRAKIRWRKFYLYLPEQTRTCRSMTHVRDRSNAYYKVSTWSMDLYWPHCCVVKEKEFCACVNQMPDAQGKKQIPRRTSPPTQSFLWDSGFHLFPRWNTSPLNKRGYGWG